MTPFRQRGRQIAPLLAALVGIFLNAGCGSTKPTEGGPTAPAASHRSGSIAITAPDPDVAAEIEAQLDLQTDLAPSTSSLSLYTVVRVPPRPGVLGDVTLAIRSAAHLPFVGLQQNPGDALERKGLYLGVVDPAGSFVSMARVGDPRIVRAEGHDGTGSSAAILKNDAGAFALRAPFVAGGRLRLFAVDGGRRVSRVFIDEPLVPAIKRASAGTLETLIQVLTGVPPYVFSFFDTNLFTMIGRPHLNLVGGSADPSNAFNVLIVGDGFDQNVNFDAYQAAVYHLVREMRRTPPFCHYADVMNFYRIDVHDPEDHSALHGSECPTGFDPTPDPLVVSQLFIEPEPPPVVSGTFTPLREDFELTRCWTEDDSGTGNSKILWTGVSGQQKLADLMGAYFLIPMRIGVIVGNTQARAGAGLYDVGEANIGMAVLGVPMQEIDGKWRVEETGEALFTHEFGHAAGLVDEYVDDNLDWSDEEPPSTTVNVWKPTKRLPWTVGESVQFEPIPWLSLMDPTCDPKNIHACCGKPPCGTAGALCGDELPDDCFYVPAVCNQSRAVICPDGIGTALPEVNEAERDWTTLCATPGECGNIAPNTVCKHEFCANHLGLFEGALYQRNGVYRSEYSCRMAKLTPDVTFCGGCLLALGEFFCKDVPHKCIPHAKLGAPCPLPQMMAVLRPFQAHIPIRGAHVEIASSNMFRRLVTDAAGMGIVPPLPPDDYVVTVRKSGFQDLVIDDLPEVGSDGTREFYIVAAPD